MQSACSINDVTSLSEWVAFRSHLQRLRQLSSEKSNPVSSTASPTPHHSVMPAG